MKGNAQERLDGLEVRSGIRSKLVAAFCHADGARWCARQARTASRKRFDTI